MYNIVFMLPAVELGDEHSVDGVVIFLVESLQPLPKLLDGDHKTCSEMLVREEVGVQRGNIQVK